MRLVNSQKTNITIRSSENTVPSIAVMKTMMKARNRPACSLGFSAK